MGVRKIYFYDFVALISRDFEKRPVYAITPLLLYAKPPDTFFET